MILDQLLRLDPAATAITSSAASTNVIDALASRDLGIGSGPGQQPTLLVTVGTAFTAAGAATLQVQWQGSVDNSTWYTLCQSDAIGKATLTAGQTIELPIGQQQPQIVGVSGQFIPRYYRAYYVVATGPMTAGTVTTDLVICGSQQQPTGAAGASSGYPSGFSVNN